jgi:hypothetical protein
MGYELRLSSGQRETCERRGANDGRTGWGGSDHAGEAPGESGARSARASMETGRRS